MCQSRSTSKSFCPLGISGPCLLDGTQSRAGKTVLNKVSKFLEPLKSAGLKVFPNCTRNQMFAGKIGQDNCVEATRAALYNFSNRLAVHVDSSNGNDPGYSDVVWASQLQESQKLFQLLLPSDNSLSSVDNDCYRLSQVLYSRASIESYFARRKKLEPYLQLFQNTYADGPTWERCFIPATVHAAKHLPCINDWCKIGATNCNMQYECHLQAYIYVAEKIIHHCDLGYIGGVGVAWILSFDPSSALGLIVAASMLLSKDSSSSTKTSCIETLSQFQGHYLKVLEDGISHMFEGKIPRFERLSVGDYNAVSGESFKNA